MTDPAPEGTNSASEKAGPAPDALEVSVPRAGVAAMSLKGEHDLSTAAELRSLLGTLVAENRTVLVDVSEAEFIDSTVLQTLILADDQARAAGQRLVLVAGTKPIVSTALRVSGVIDCLECATSVEEAISAK
jgi:anti-sigma B factor antagonist